MPIAYSYVRFSSEPQSRGDSVRRQQSAALRFIDENPELGLVLDEQLNMNDLGVSAFKAKNLLDGALGKFTALVYSGQIEEGSYLLLENLDRFSRAEPWKAVNDLTTLVRAGINVVSLCDDQTFSEETLSGEGGSYKLMQSVMTFMRANDESVQKSRRVKAAWGAKMGKIAQGVQLTRRVPFWINPDDKSRLLKDKVKVIKRIYSLAVKGYGANTITKTLNADGIPSAQGKAKYWSAGTVKKLLKTKSVIGTLVTGDGEEHKDYFPAVITDRQYQEVQNRNLSSKSARIGVLSPQPLAGLAWCARCGGKAHHVVKHGKLRKDGTKAKWRYLVCAQSIDSEVGCKYQAVTYDDIVSTVLRVVERHKYIDAKDKTLTEIRKLEDRLRELEAVLDFGVDSKSSLAKQRYAQALREAGEIDGQIKQLKASRSPLSRRIFEAAQNSIVIEGERDNAAFRQIIKRIEVDFDNKVIKVDFLDNGQDIGWINEFEYEGLEPDEFPKKS